MMHKLRIAIALQATEPYRHHSDVLAGTQRYADECGNWECVIDEHPLYTSAKYKRRQRYDGVIARVTPAMHRRLKAAGVPAVNTWFNSPARDTVDVFSDGEAVGRLIAEHLLNRGFRRFGHISTKNDRFRQIIAQSLSHTIEQAGCECIVTEYPLVGYKSADDWVKTQQHIESFVDQFTPPVAITCAEGSDARFVTTLCRARRWNVPRDVAVLSERDTPVLLESPPPGITSVDQNFERVGYEAARLLDQMIDGSPPPPQPILIPPRGIIARESTDYFAVEDDMVAAALQFVANHLRREIHLEHVANAIHTSSRTLQRRFNDVLGRSVTQEIRRLRLELARRMLVEEEHTIDQIARHCGFGHADVMRKVFQREVGESPSQYRQRVAGKQF